MSTLKLDIQHAHSDDLSEAFSGKFGNIYHTWDQGAARRREIDDTQRRIASNAALTTKA